jgi:hypothetical protein
MADDIVLSSTGITSRRGLPVPFGSVFGSVAPSGDLILDSTADATKGQIKLQSLTRVLDQAYTTVGFFANEDFFVVGDRNDWTLQGAVIPRGILYNPVLIYDAPSAFSGGRSFENSPILKNPPGVAKTIPHQTGFYSNPSVIADGAAVISNHSAFLAATDLSVENGGTLTHDHRADFDSIMAIGAGVTVSMRRGLRFADATGAGSLTTQIGVDIEALAKGTLNIGIRNASTYVATPSVAQIIDAVGDTILANAEVVQVNNNTGGSITLTSAPTIANGQDGQEVEIISVSSAQNIVLQDQGTLASSNLRLTATTVTLGPRDSIKLRYNATIGDWVQIAPVTNVL